MPCTRSTACKISRMDATLSVPGDGRRYPTEVHVLTRKLNRRQKHIVGNLSGFVLFAVCAILFFADRPTPLTDCSQIDCTMTGEIRRTGRRGSTVYAIANWNGGRLRLRTNDPKIGERLYAAPAGQPAKMILDDASNVIALTLGDEIVQDYNGHCQYWRRMLLWFAWPSVGFAFWCAYDAIKWYRI